MQLLPRVAQEVVMRIELRYPEPRTGAPVTRVTARQLQELRSKLPGRWACIRRCGSVGSAASFVSRLRRNPQLPDGPWEFTVRSCADGSAEVFAAFIPAPSVADC